MTKITVAEIVWDDYGEDVDLPSDVTLEVEADDDIADLLADKYGWCVESYLIMENGLD